MDMNNPIAYLCLSTLVMIIIYIILSMLNKSKENRHEQVYLVITIGVLLLFNTALKFLKISNWIYGLITMGEILYIFIVKGIIKANKNKKGLNRISEYFYEIIEKKNEKIIVLRNSLYLTKMTTKYFSWVLGIFSIGSLTYVISEITKKPFVMDSYKHLEFYTFSIISFICVFEIFNFLNGISDYQLAEKKENNLREHINETPLEDFNTLYLEYKNIWGNNILADIKINKEKKEIEKDDYRKILGNNKEASEAYKIIENYYDKSIFLEIFKNLFEKKDLIISDANYEEMAPIVFSYLERSIIKGKKIIVLVENNIYSNDANREALQNWFKEWFKKLYKKSIRNVATFEQWKNQNEWDIVIGTQNELIKSQEDFINKIQREQNELKDIIILLLNEKPDEIAENILALSILTNILNTHFRIDKSRNDEGAQYVILGNGASNLKQSIDKNLGISTLEYSVPNEVSENFYGVIWKTDTSKEYYTEIMNGIPKGKIGIGNTLSYLAWANQISQINFIENDKLPHNVYENEVISGTSLLKDIPIAKESLKGSYKEIIKNNFLGSMISKDKQKFMFVEDNNFNAPVLMKKYSDVGRENTFVNVISPNYLLRDYFIDNIDFFFISPKYAYTPKIESDKFKVASYLKEILTNNILEVSEEDIKIELATIKDKIENVEKEIIDLFNEIYNVDILKNDYLIVNHKEVYDKDLGRFQEKKFYRLNPLIKENSYFEWFENYEIIDGGKRVYGKIELDHLYQNYLPDQVHSFNGDSFKVDKIDHENKKINISPASQGEKVIYRNKDAIKVHNFSEIIDKKEIQNSKYTLVKVLQNTNYSIKTQGYYEFIGNIDFNNKNSKYNVIDSLEERFYKNGRILSLEIKFGSNIITDVNGVALGLTAVLSEIFKTLFPGNNKYIKIFTLFSENIGNCIKNHDYSFIKYENSESLSHVLPKEIEINKIEIGENFKENNEESITLYFMEDSHKDTGILSAIRDDFQEILELVQEYLNWLYLDNIPKKNWNKGVYQERDKFKYLKYGLGEIDSSLNLWELKKCLDEMLGSNSLTEARKRYYNKINDDINEDEFDREYNYLREKINENREEKVGN